MKQLIASMSIFRQPRGLRRSETVKAKILLLCAGFAITPLLSAQVNCSNYVKLQTNSVLAQLKVNQGPLVCQFPFNANALAQTYFGGNGVTSAAQLGIFTGLSQSFASVTAPLNASIASQLSQLPMPSASAGTIQFKLPGSDVPQPFNNLGPLLTDRPDTLPKRHFFLSFAYQHFNFTEIDGLGLSSLNLASSVSSGPSGGLPAPNSPTQDCTQEGASCGTLYAGLQSSVSFQLDQYIALLTYGLTNSTEISVAVPINSVSTKTTSSQYNSYFYVPANSSNATPAQYLPLAQYDPKNPQGQTPLQTSGSATGVGDVMVNVKQMLLGEVGRYAVAAGAQFRFPSGDANNYLGSGAYGANIYGIVEYRASYKGHGIAPHLKFGYQWNGQSQIMDIQSPPHLRLPGGLDYAFGSDFGILRTLSFAVDGVGHQYVNAPVLNSSSLSMPAVPSQQMGFINIPNPSNPSLPTVSNGTTTYTTFNFSGGFKWMPPGVKNHIVIYGNVLVPVNDVGLHSDPVPMAGIAFIK